MNQGSEIYHSVEEIPMLHRRLFGYEIDLYDAIELLDLILRKTGSMSNQYILLKGAQIINHELKLPQNVYSVKYVCDSLPLSYYGSFLSQFDSRFLINYRVDQTGNLGAYNADATTTEYLGEGTSEGVYVVNEKVFSRPLGSLINFNNKENHCLEFNFKSRKVDVLCILTLLDENGYPKLPEKTLEAVCYYLHYIEMRKRFNANQCNANQMDLAKREKDTAVASARTPTAISDNEYNMILDVWTSFNRKRYNRQTRV
jgi:hypothetical protein